MIDKLVQLLIDVIDLFRFWVVIDQYERAVQLRLGKVYRTLEPGFWFQFPFHIDRTLHANVTVETAHVGPQSITTKDGKEVVMGTVVTYHIENISVFLLEVEGAHQVIEDSALGTIGEYVRTKSWDELATMNVGNEIAKRVRSRAKRYGVAIDDVQLSDLTRSKSLRLIQDSTHRSHIGV